MAKDLVRTRRYVQKFYQMRTQLQAVGLRIQTLRSNQQMAEAMRGATRVRPRPPRLLRPVHLMLRTGYGCHEQGPQSSTNTANHDGVRTRECDYGHEGRDDVRRRG